MTPSPTSTGRAKHHPPCGHRRLQWPWAKHERHKGAGLCSAWRFATGVPNRTAVSQFSGSMAGAPRRRRRCSRSASATSTTRRSLGDRCSGCAAPPAFPWRTERPASAGPGDDQGCDIAVSRRLAQRMEVAQRILVGPSTASPVSLMLGQAVAIAPPGPRRRTRAGSRRCARSPRRYPNQGDPHGSQEDPDAHR